jgi:fructoselysine-6-P-deglycase FrlB-like protein
MSEIKNEPIRQKRKRVWPYSYPSLIQDFLAAINSIQDCFDYYFQGPGRYLLTELQNTLSELKFEKVIFIGNSISHFASYVPRALFMEHEKNLPFTWELFEISEFSDYILPQERDEKTIYIFLSTSGVSRLLKQCIEHLDFLKINSKQIWLITNNINTPVAKFCGFSFPMMVDKETVLGTKTYMTTILILFFIARIFMKEEIFNGEMKHRHSQLIQTLQDIADTWEQTIKTALDFFGYDFQFLYLISSGTSMSAAYLGALSAKSYCRFFAEAIPQGLFFHGPVQIIDENFRAVILAGDDPTEEKVIFLTRLIKIMTEKLGKGRILLISNNIKLYEGLDSNPQLLKINFRCEEPGFSPIIEAFISQFLYLEIAHKRELIPD